MDLQKIILRYTFKKNDWCEARNQPYGRIDPVLEYGEIEEEFDYTINVDSDDLARYLIEEHIGKNTFKDFTQQKQEGFRRAVDLLWENGFICDLEYFDDFLDWLKKDREEDARREFED